jgi:hypothetical protein
MNRRSILAGTPLAAMVVIMPGATLGEIYADHALIALCGEAIALNAWIVGEYPKNPTLEAEQLYDARMLPFVTKKASR